MEEALFALRLENQALHAKVRLLAGGTDGEELAGVILERDEECRAKETEIGQLTQQVGIMERRLEEHKEFQTEYEVMALSSLHPDIFSFVHFAQTIIRDLQGRLTQLRDTAKCQAREVDALNTANAELTDRSEAMKNELSIAQVKKKVAWSFSPSTPVVHPIGRLYFHRQKLDPSRKMFAGWRGKFAYSRIYPRSTWSGSQVRIITSVHPTNLRAWLSILTTWVSDLTKREELYERKIAEFEDRKNDIISRSRAIKHDLAKNLEEEQRRHSECSSRLQVRLAAERNSAKPHHHIHFSCPRLNFHSCATPRLLKLSTRQLSRRCST